MRRTLCMVLAATVVASPMAVVAQTGVQAPQPRFSQEATEHAVRAATPIAARSDRSAIASQPSPAQEPIGSWEALVGAIKTGRMITVTLSDATRVDGRLRAIDARSLTLEQPGGRHVFEAADVLRVRYASHRKRHVIHGMLVGMVVGAVATVLIDKQSSHPSSAVEAAGLGAIFIGLPAGAVVGALVPTGQLLYEATTAVRSTP